MIGLKLLDLLVLAGYFVIVAVIGVMATRLIRTREDYVMGGRRFGKAMMMMFAFGAGTHADNAVGVAAQSYRYGLSGIWYQWIMVFTLPIYWLLVPVFRRARVLTTADFFERRFGLLMMYVYSAFALFVMLSFNGVMLYGSGKMIEALTGHEVPWRVAIIAMAVVSFFYGIMGGLIAAVWNDFFQGILTVVMSLLLIPFFWHRVGGLDGFQAKLAASGHPSTGHLFDLVLKEDMTVFWIVMMTISSLISMVAQPQIMASTAAGKTEMDCRIGFVGGMILKRLMTIPWALSGVMAVALLGHSTTIDSDHVFGLMSAELLPAGCIGLMLACVMASVMDNCAVNMLSFSGTYTNSIHSRLISPAAGERQLVRVNRVASIAFALVSLGLSFLFTDMPAAMRFLAQTVPLMGIPWFFAILWRRTTRWGAIASFAAALAGSAFGNFAMGWKGDAGLPYTISLYLASGIIAGIVVSLLTRPESDIRVDHFFLLLKTPIGQEHVLHEAGFRETPGNNTFELPQSDEIDSPSLRESVAVGGPANTVTDRGSTAMIVAPSRPRAVALSHWLDKIDSRVARRQSIAGFLALLAIVITMLIGVRILASWLASA